MIIDKEMELASKQSIAGTAKSQKSIDLGPNTWAKNSNGTERIKFLITVDEDASGDGTVTFQIRSSENEDMSGADVHMQSRPLATTDLKVGKEVPFYPDLPFDVDRYIDMRWVVGGSVSTGKVTINGISSRQMNK